MPTRREPFRMGASTVQSGSSAEATLPIALRADGSSIALRTMIVHGASAGPTVWVNAAIHGDEVNGVEVIRRVLEVLDPKVLRGTLLAVPIVNVPGFMSGDRYLPDRRDLNRSFPGSARGSLAGRIAHLFMHEIVQRCSVGIDLHTGSDHRTNLPQVRADLDDPETLRLATAFGAPLMMHAAIRDGSLRQAAREAGAAVLLFEGGEAWRFDEAAIRVGAAGVRRVIEALDMIDAQDHSTQTVPTPMQSRSSRWVRARRSGIVMMWVTTGDTVMKGQPIGQIHDSLGRRLSQVKAPVGGVVVGLNLDPIVNQGDALVHIAHISPTEPGDNTTVTRHDLGSADPAAPPAINASSTTSSPMSSTPMSSSPNMEQQ